MDPRDPDELSDDAPLDESEPNLTPIYMGERIEAEIIRALLEENGIPAVVFGTGYYEMEGALHSDRVMVRESDFAAAREVIAAADLPDAATLPDDEYEDDIYDHDDVTDPTDVEVLAGGSDWGPRIVGIIGLLALAIAIAVLVTQAD